MNIDVMGEWLRRQGHRVLRTASSGWYDASPHVYQAFPAHWVIRPTEEELATVLRGQRAAALRYSTPVDAPLGRLSYHLTRTGSYGLETLERRARQGVRHGLERCSVERIPLERLAEEGWPLEVDTCRRQGRSVTRSRAAWRRRYLAAAELPGFEAWGALVEGQLASALLAVQVGDCLELVSQQCLTRHLEAHVNSALAFTVTRDALARPGIGKVFYTLESLDAPASVDVFKLRMGFVAVPLRQRVAFHPWLTPALGSLGWLTHACAARLPIRTALAKADGMFRFYREGLRPLAEQPWPECLPRSGAAPERSTGRSEAPPPALSAPSAAEQRPGETP
jgi:hypothetical protein